MVIPGNLWYNGDIRKGLSSMRKLKLLSLLLCFCFTQGCSVMYLEPSDTGTQTTAAPSAVTASQTVRTSAAASSVTTVSAVQAAPVQKPKTAASAVVTAPSVTATASAASVSVPAVSTTTAAATTASQTTTAKPVTAASTAAAAAQPASEDWMLRLANKTHPVGEYAPPALVTLKNGTKVDARMYPALQKMYDDMRAQGLKPMTREAYRTYAQQQDIMQTRIRQHKNEGKSDKEAKRLAEMYVAVPGTSEHQLGLAVDINSEDGNHWNVYNWLVKNAYKYGFILRYPQGKEKITGFQYEAWHYRYVGETAALVMQKSGQTLEEYLGAV